MAYGLLACTPWQWETLMRRGTVAEVEQMISGALWRAARHWDTLAWQTAILLNVQGAKTEDGEPWTPEQLLHRPMVLGDPRAEAAVTETPRAESSEKVERGMAMIQEATLQRAMRRLPRPPSTH